MIHLIATILIKPGTKQDVIAAATPCIAATRNEPGCVRYDLNADVLDENKLVFVEEWKTRDDLTKHFEQPHMDTWRDAAAHLIIDRTIQVIHPQKVELL